MVSGSTVIGLVRQDHQVGELSGFDGTFEVLLEVLPRRVDRHGTHRLHRRDPLLWSENPVSPGPSVDRYPHELKWVDRRHGCIVVDGEANSAVD